MSSACAIGHRQCSSALNRCGIPGIDWCLNPYVGCSHACAYCYADTVARFQGHQEAWGLFVDAKDNIAQVLQRQTRRQRSGVVTLSTVTDPYQAAESDCQLTRACLEVLANSGLDVSILTKSDLVVRDLDRLRTVGGLLRESSVRVGFSFSTLSDDLALVLEPGAPVPSRRLAALAQLALSGIATWAFLAPIIPGVGDTEEELEEKCAALLKRGATEVLFDPLNFYPLAVRRLDQALRQCGPTVWSSFLAAVDNPQQWQQRVSRSARIALQRAWSRHSAP